VMVATFSCRAGARYNLLVDCFQQMQGDLEEIFKSTHSPFLGQQGLASCSLVSAIDCIFPIP
jgi:hypothetical protein